MIARSLTYQEIARNNDKVALLPVGSLEQHGPFLPIGADVIAAEAVAQDLEKQLSDKIVLYPALSYGCSKEHAGFAGTTFFEFETYMRLMSEILESIAAAGFKKIIILGGHGGNHLVLQLIQANFNYKHKDVKVFYHFIYSQEVYQYATKLFGGMEDHAGSVETSVIYHISPEYIKTNKTKIKNKDFRNKYSDSYALYTTKEMVKLGVVTSSATVNISLEKGKKVFDFVVKAAKDKILGFMTLKKTP